MKNLIVSALIGLVLCFGQSSLAQNTANLDKTQASKYKVLFVSARHSNRAKVSKLKELLKTDLSKLELQLEQKDLSSFKSSNTAVSVFNQYDLVILDSVSKRFSAQSYGEYITLRKNINTKLLAINWLEETRLQQGVASAVAKDLHDYYGNGGRQNLMGFLQTLQYRVLSPSTVEIADPIIFPGIGLYHPKYPQTVFSQLQDYLAWRQWQPDADKPKIGVLMQRAMIETMDTQLVDTAIASIEAKGAIAVPFFFEVSPRSSDYTHLLQRTDAAGQQTTFVDSIVNFRSIHWAAKRQSEFKKLNVPVLQALTYFDGDQAAWEADSQGVSAMMMPFALVLPETAGVIDPMIVAAVNQRSGATEIIDYQLDHFINKALKQALLAHKPAKDKRLTVMVWGSSDVGASFLNVPESLRAITQGLNKQGYAIPAVEESYFSDQVDRILTPFYREYELDKLLQDDLAELMPVADYLSWFNTLPAAVRKPIDDYWGQAENNFMVVKRDGKAQFVIPRIRAGNMLVMRQPPRSDDKEQEQRIYHKGTIPMNHYYLAAYYYARKFWQSDALVHLGTHGSQEYLSGKERGLSKYDQGNLAVWDTPVIYPFIVDDVGEAMQTKRRGSATVLAHMTPPFAAAGLQGELADLHELMHQYRSMDTGGVKQKTAQQITEQCFTSSICADMGWQQAKVEAEFPEFMQALHEYMEELAAQNQPLGLHTFGELPEQRLVVSTLLQMLGKDFIGPADAYEEDVYAEHGHKHSHDNDTAAAGDENFTQTISQENGAALENLVGFKTLRDLVVAPPQVLEIKHLPKNLQPLIIKARALYKDFSGIKEMDHLIAALNAEYIPVKNGGDPVRSPAAVPTGFNLVGFDPSRVPTQAAFEQGKVLVEDVIANYYQEHGRYPDKLAFSLWSIETMRHYGVLEAQALYAMGVKPKWSSDGRVIGTEIIPASELKRPRVDVVLSATGLYRDAFPNVMQRLAHAIQSVAELKEANNSVWNNSQKVEQQLLAEGVAAAEAQYLSTVRIFSNSSGNYGSGVSDAVFASGSWEQDGKISDNYLSKMGYYYGADNSRWGKQVEGLYAQQLSGTDVALFSRSSNIFGMLSSDDPFEYFGSLALAVRNIDGKSPQMMISNLRQANGGKTETAAKFLAKELRSRQFHKRWIEEMKKEGYSGAVAMSGQLANFWGWQVVDPNVVRDDQWQEFYEVYVKDKHKLNLDEWFEQVNPKSQAQMLEWMLEANRKDYWQADSQTLKNIVERYQELLNKHDLLVKNEKMRDYLEQTGVGFGLQMALPAPEVAAAVAAPQSEAVQGQKLEQVQQNQQEQEWDSSLIYALIFSFAALLLGGLKQLRSSRTGLRLASVAQQAT